MWLYATTAALLGALASTLWLGIWAGSGRDPRNVLREAYLRLATEPLYLAILSGLPLLLGVNWLQNRMEPYLTDLVPWDLTPVAASIGTAWILALQGLEWGPLTHLMVYIYVILFPTLPLICLVIFASKGDLQTSLLLLRNYVNTYLAALPFYLLAPVREAWTADVSIRFLIPSLYPAFEEQFRQWSALDNCFPSLHTSLAITVFLVARKSGYPRLARVLGVSSILVAFSTLYLGVHWVPDVFGGMILAFAVAALTPQSVPGRHASVPVVQRCSGSSSDGNPYKERGVAKE